MADFAYFIDRHGVPSHPRDLQEHRCLRFHLGDDSIYRWEFEKDGEEIAIDVPGAITLNQTQFALDLAAAGAGRSRKRSKRPSLVP